MNCQGDDDSDAGDYDNDDDSVDMILMIIARFGGQAYGTSYREMSDSR